MYHYSYLYRYGLDAHYTLVFLLEHDPLLYMVYEHGSTTGKSLQPYLWTYRSHITLEHLALLLQPQQDECCILAEFLKQVMQTMLLHMIEQV